MENLTSIKRSKRWWTHSNTLRRTTRLLLPEGSDAQDAFTLICAAALIAESVLRACRDVFAQVSKRQQEARLNLQNAPVLLGRARFEKGPTQPHLKFWRRCPPQSLPCSSPLILCLNHLKFLPHNISVLKSR